MAVQGLPTSPHFSGTRRARPAYVIETPPYGTRRPIVWTPYAGKGHSDIIANKPLSHDAFSRRAASRN